MRGDAEAHAEEDKKPEKEQEYYYADYLLRIGEVTKEQYDLGLELSKQIIDNKENMSYHPELREMAEETEPEETQTQEEIKEKIFKNMSERARQMLTDDMEYLGPVRAKEVQEAQTGIVNAIRTLEATGEITITRASIEDELIE